MGVSGVKVDAFHGVVGGEGVVVVVFRVYLGECAFCVLFCVFAGVCDCFVGGEKDAAVEAVCGAPC